MSGETISIAVSCLHLHRRHWRAHADHANAGNPGAMTLRDAETAEKRAKLRQSLATGKPLADPTIANDRELRKDYAYDESRPDRTLNEELDLDDEYSQLSGIVEPRVLVTTSRDQVRDARYGF